jgi:DNA polymerase-3 subunit epsilon/oligoribonuclease
MIAMFKFLRTIWRDALFGVFLDTETNGLNYKEHSILEIAFMVVDLINGSTLKTFDSIIKQPFEKWQKSDQGSLKVTGFTYEEIQKGKNIETVANEIRTLFKILGINREKAVFICQNPSFDRIFFSQIISPDEQEVLMWPYHWLDLASMHWASVMPKSADSKQLFPWEIGLSKDSIATYQKIPPESKPHRALNGVKHLLACYKAVVGFPLCKKEAAFNS